MKSAVRRTPEKTAYLVAVVAAVTVACSACPGDGARPSAQGPRAQAEDPAGGASHAASPGEGGGTAARAGSPAETPPAPAIAPESCLGVADRGIFSDLDEEVEIELPPEATAEKTTALVDETRSLLVLYVGGWPAKVYPLTGKAVLQVGDRSLALRPGDRAELESLLRPSAITSLAKGEAPPPGDADGDGIPDPLDLLIGAHKTAINGASYGAGYIILDYPGGDIPRDKGVCTDVIVRAARNAGLDIQRELHVDIGRAPRAYPMVKKRDKNIDHRRVKTSLPYFERQWDERSSALDDPSDPLRPGDVVFLDTFPSRSGPDHVGVVSERRAEDGTYLVINNWTEGYTTRHMELLSWVPVTHRFRFPSKSVSRRR